MQVTKLRTLFTMLALTLALAPAAAQSIASPPVAPPAARSEVTAAVDQRPALAGRSLEDLLKVEVDTVFGASKHEQRVTEAPSSVTILTAADIRTFGWRTLAEALTSVRGFYTTYDRNYTYVGVRGFGRPSDYNNRVLVLVNGHRFNDNVYDQALIGGEFPIDLALVDRIEIIRGPGSALYGTSAFFAVINVMLRRGGAIAGREASLEVGSASTYRLRGTWGARATSGLDALLSVSHTSSSGQSLLYFPEYDDPATGFGLSRDGDGDEATSVFGALTRGRLTVQGAYGTREKGVPTGAYGTTFGDRRNRTIDARGWIDASVSGAAAGTTLTGRLFADYTGYRGAYFFDEGTVENRDTARGLWVGGEGMASRRLGSRHTLTTGLEYRFNVHQDQHSWDVDPFFEYLQDHRDSHEVGVYVQDQIQLHRRLTATVGGRYDWWGLVGGTGRPRVGLVYRTDANTAIKALFGAAYRAPTVFEQYYEPNPLGDIRPEQVKTSEIVYEQYVGQLRLTATAYFTDADNLIAQAGETESPYFQNLDEVHAHGVELEAERRWASGVLVRGSFVTQKARDPKREVETSNSPRHLAVVHAAAPLLARRLSLALEQQFVGSRLTNAGASTGRTWLTNLNVAFTPARHPLSLSARVVNLFDRRYVHPVGLEFRQDVIPQDGRAISLRAMLRF
jgi:outer membrane receptor protein involved in Fe transport